MGKYYEIFGELTIATMEKDADKVTAAAEEMLSSMEEIGSFRYSPLYEHMAFKEVNKEFITEMRENLLRCFREEESYSFLQDDERWKKLVQRSTDN